MSDDLRQDLETALGPDFSVERELGGGGMSHVFVARDRSLDRYVVVKVLPREMAAGVNADRFKREIHLAAALQHPHIVPVLAAGQASGLPYFTMPFVEGESLRARLAKGERVPIREAVGLLQDIAKALSYAHERGVVHRDIKPDNVLVSGGAAMVTDFGVAKALSSSRDKGADNPADALTVVGMSLGTPLYMAPEQAAADPSTDHRADIYAFGVMAYELLTGEPPFRGTSLQQLLVAHLTQAPPPILEKRPEIPASLAALVTRCLAKDPALRPQSAREIVTELDDVPTSTGAIPAASAKAIRPRRRIVLAAGGVLVLGVAVVGLLLSRRGRVDAAALEADRVVVAPFDNETGDKAFDPVGRMAADWLTQGLAQTGLVKVVDPKTALTSAGNDAGGSKVQQVAMRTGASRVITGEYYHLGDSLTWQTKMIDARTGEVIFSLDPVAGPVANPTLGIEQLRQRLLGAMAVRYNPALKNWAATAKRPPTYAAYQAFVEAMSKQLQPGTAAERAALLERAVSLDSTYMTAWVWLANAYFQLDRAAKADSILDRIKLHRDELGPFDAALADLENTYTRGDMESRLAASRRVAAAAPGTEWRIALVEALLGANHPREALDTLEHMNPDQGMLKGTPVILSMRMTAELQLGRGDAAQSLIEEGMRKYPNIPGWDEAMVEALAMQHKWDDVDRLIAKIADKPRTATYVPRNVLRSLAQEIRFHGDSVRARKVLERVLASYSSQPESLSKPAFRNGQAQTLFLLERFSEAKPLFESMLAENTRRPPELVARVGIIAARTGDRAGALRASDELAKRSTDYHRREFTFWRAHIMAQLGDTAQAIQLLKDAFAQGISPTSAHADMLLEPLYGNPAYEALVRPKG